VYADPDRNALHTRLCDVAYNLPGTTATETYLDPRKMLDVATCSGADAVHPGYGFLSESEIFAQLIIDAGLVWIGPPPEAIRVLGDKVEARRLAARAGAPLVPGTSDPVTDVEEILDFIDAHGLPVAIKAAHGGGGRGLKVARRREEVKNLFAAAVREAEAAFGRGECFVERFLDRPRHVETQCLADAYGNIVVVSTRDCSLQRRHQKLVEEAPAPFLTAEQESELRRASIAILRAARYVGAGTVEFLVGVDGTISFLEVNARLQVEHPVTEEVAGFDLVSEQLRIAAGEPLGYDAVSTRGHSLELRINSEDPGAGFLPASGSITDLRWPSGPGVRVDTGVVTGDTVSAAFDSMLAKLIITGHDRQQTIARARRALSEIEIAGVPTVIPFHRAVLSAPEFTGSDPVDFRVHTTWIETEFADRLSRITTAVDRPPSPTTDADTLPTDRYLVEVDGRRMEVLLPETLSPRRRQGTARPSPKRSRRRRDSAVDPGALLASIQGIIVTIAVAEGDVVQCGDVILTLEAMKMEHPVTAHRGGRIHRLTAAIGDEVTPGTALCRIDDV